MKFLTYVIALILLSLSSGVASGYQTPAQTDKWARYSPENCGLSLELSSKPSKLSFQIPDELKAIMRYMNLYASRSGPVSVVMTNVSSSETLPVREFTEGVIEGFNQGAGISDLKYLLGATTDGKLPINGYYTLNGARFEMNGVAIGVGKQAWVIICTYKQDNQDATKNASRTLASIKMDGTPCADEKATSQP